MERNAIAALKIDLIWNRETLDGSRWSVADLHRQMEKCAVTTQEKYRKLVERLYVMTQNRAIDWKYDAQLGTYANLSERMVVLSETFNFDEEPLEVVTIRSKNWESLDEFNDEHLKGKVPSGPDPISNYYEMMRLTHVAAYRQAVGADEAIDDILKALD